MDTQFHQTAGNSDLPQKPASKLFTADHWQKLVRNGQIAAINPDKSSLSLYPVVKLFTPDAAATWLFTEVTPDGFLFGLCDLGLWFPELGYASIDEIISIRGRFGLPVERDRFFTATASLGDYLDLATQNGHIIA